MSNRLEKCVLFAVLDWGLGHATRSSVIIDELINQNATVIIASSGNAANYLQKKYPSLVFLTLPDKPILYGIRSAHVSLIQRGFRQPSINRKQHGWIEKKVDELGITHIVSDNVYGAYHKRIPTAIISHQLNLPTGWLSGFSKPILRSWLEKFQEVWIPDIPGINSLAGELANTHHLENRIEYLGIISRFKSYSTMLEKSDILAFSSGVEHQVSQFERILVNELAEMSGNKILAGHGKFLKAQQPINGLRLLKDADVDLMEALGNTNFVICRSGYSSLSDLLRAGRRALVIPTPGQPEQEYLAKRVAEKGWFATIDQNKLTKQKIQDAIASDSCPPEIGLTPYPTIIKRFLGN